MENVCMDTLFHVSQALLWCSMGRFKGLINVSRGTRVLNRQDTPLCLWELGLARICAVDAWPPMQEEQDNDNMEKTHTHTLTRRHSSIQVAPVFRGTGPSQACWIWPYTVGLDTKGHVWLDWKRLCKAFKGAAANSQGCSVCVYQRQTLSSTWYT